MLFLFDLRLWSVALCEQASLKAWCLEHRSQEIMRHDTKCPLVKLPFTLERRQKTVAAEGMLLFCVWL